MGFAKELYTKHYYENLVLGAKDWKSGDVRPEHKKLLGLVNLKDARVLDLGCGRGDVLRYCLQQGASHVTGVDFSPAAIELSKQTLSGLENWSLQAGDALEILPRLESGFDVILMMDTIEHIPANEIHTILTRLHELLADDGRIIVNTPFYRMYEDYVKQGEYIRPSPTDKNPLTKGMHCTKYTQGRLLDLMMNRDFQCLDMDAALFKKADYHNHVVCAYYTENTPYEQEIIQLRSSLIKLGIPYFIKPVSNLSKWEFNCGQKPAFIKECLLRFPDRVIMYTDADSVLMRYPDLLTTFTGNIAVHRLGGKELLSGTIIFNSNPATLKIVDNWIFEQAATPNEWDQRVLERVLKDVTVENLPLEYIQIFDHSVKCADPVVVHNQASRRLKNTVAVTGLTEIYLPPFITGWRQLQDGSICLVRSNKRAEVYLDDNYCRVKNELKWWPLKMDPTVMKETKDIHKGVITIIGKGPSLDKVTEADIIGPTIALNEAFKITEKFGVQYGTQLDAWMKDACTPVAGTLFVSPRAKVHYPGNNRVRLLDPRQLGLSATPASLEYAIALAIHMGATSIRLLCFDALANGNCDYAKSVGYSPTNMGDPKRFLKHDKILEKFKIKFTFA